MSENTSIAIEFAAALEKHARKPRSKATRQESLPEPEVLLARSNSMSRERTIEPSPVETLVREIEEVAAVSGRLNPGDLFGPDVTEDVRQAVLTRLAAECKVESSGGKVRWLLLNDARSLVLNRLIEEERLKSQLEQGPLPETDLFGSALRELLRDGQQVRIEGRTREELSALLSAVEATSGVKLAKLDEGLLRKLLKRSKFLSDYDVLLEKGFVGRASEYEALKRFASGESGDPLYNWSGLVLTGLGGAGKSTLMAKVAREVFEEQKATVVILDFDRPGIDARDFYWLEIEMTRQVGSQYPEVDEMLREYRQEVRRQVAESRAEPSSAFLAEQVGFERGLRRTVSGIAEALYMVGAVERPFLLVLDTFEEVTQRDLTRRLLEWLNEIASRIEPTRLRVVFSGRLYDEELESLDSVGIVKKLELEEMDAVEAEQVLVNHGLSQPAANRLANSDVLPRRPLELRLLANLLGGKDERAAELEEEIREGGEAAGGLFAGVVYRRVLRRIENETARALAYPGLVLRYVTVPLIQKVLVPALDELPTLDDKEAKLALEALASYRWLTYRGPDGEVFHRKDLRRSMLKAMIAHESDRARRINKAAAEFYKDAKNEADWAEGVYHRLMLATRPEDGENFDDLDLKRAARYIGADIVDLPPPAAALLKVVSTGSVSVADLKLLPPRWQWPAYEQKGAQLVGSREFGRALELYAQRPDVQGHPRHLSTNPVGEWETDLLFNTATWDELVKAPRPFQTRAEDQPLAVLADKLFPREIVSPETVSIGQVERALSDCQGVGRAILKGIPPERVEVTVQRIIVALMLLHQRGRLPRRALAAARSLLDNITAVVKEPGPHLERRLLFLFLLGIRPTFELSGLKGLRLSPSTLKLDFVWMANLPTLIADETEQYKVKDLVTDASTALFNNVSSPTNAIRHILADIDGLVKMRELRGGGLSLNINWQSATAGDMVRLLRGPDPDFRDPCRFALLEAFPDESSRAELARIFSYVVRYRLADFEPQAFAAVLSTNPEHALESYVEFIDRCWSLGFLLRRASLSRPQAAKLARVTEAYNRWDTAVRHTIRNAFRPVLNWKRQR